MWDEKVLDVYTSFREEGKWGLNLPHISQSLDFGIKDTVICIQMTTSERQRERETLTEY